MGIGGMDITPTCNCFVLLFAILLAYVCTTTSAIPQKCVSKFGPNLKDLRQGRLRVIMKNPTENVLEYTKFLSCPTLTILSHGKQHVSISGGQSLAMPFILRVSKRHAKKNPDQFEHKCVFTRWIRSTNNTTPVEKCDIIIRTYPGGFFLEKCHSYKGKDLVV